MSTVDGPRPLVQGLTFLGAIILGTVIAGVLAARPLGVPEEHPAPVIVQPSLDPAALLAEHGDNVMIEWTSNETVNCGAAKSPSHVGGCFRSTLPNRIVVSPELTGEALRYVILHELVHAQQNREGRPLDECEADRIAAEWGARIEYTAYNKECAP